MQFGPKVRTEGNDVLEDIVDTYKDSFGLEHELFGSEWLGLDLLRWQEMLGYALLAMIAALLWSTFVGRRRGVEPWAGERWLRLAVVVAFVGVGLWRAYERATCFDDAYISLRYAENFVAGEGLVYNLGEHVEGYTNFLWTILISLLMWVTPVEAPLLAVLASLVAFAANLFVVWRISLKIAPPFHERAFAIPIAVGLLAVQNTFTDYGTTGLETGFASLVVNLGVLALISGDDAKHTFWAGFCWILATLTRPDHALFYAIGSGVVFVTWVGPAWRARKSGLEAIWREGVLPMATYAAPFLIWLAYAAWKLRYYGELMPNTYYAKSAYLTYYEQGVVYAAAFHLASHLWLVIIPVFFLWVLRGPSNIPARRFASFAIPAVLLYELYVVRVGGDFMYGRFYVTLIPLILLAGEQVVHEYSMSRVHRKQVLARLRAARRSRREPDPDAQPDSAAEPEPAARRNPLAMGAIVMVGFMAASAAGVRLIPARKSYWHLTDESTYYPIVRWSPMVIDHANYRVGMVLADVNAKLEGQDVTQPIIATGAIGLLGYYSRMELIDRLGLTDATVAHREIETRGRPGHEKWAEPEYIRERGVHFRRGGGYPRWFQTYGSIRWGENLGGRNWVVLIYDREMMNAIREAEPDVWFYDFEIYIDKYIARLPHLSPRKARHEFGFFRRYYFDHNEDPARREAFSTYFQWVREGNKPRDLLKDGRWDDYKARAAEASVRERELRTTRAQRRRDALRWRIPWLQPALRRQYGLSPSRGATKPPRPLPSPKSSKPGSKPGFKPGSKPKPSVRPTRPIRDDADDADPNEDAAELAEDELALDDDGDDEAEDPGDDADDDAA